MPQRITPQLMQRHYRHSSVTRVITHLVEHERCLDPTLYFTTTSAHNPSSYNLIVAEFGESIRAISTVEKMNWYMSLQPSAALNGENSLGLNPRDNRLNIVILVAFFPNQEDSPSVRRAAKGRSDRLRRSLGQPASTVRSST
ncbi:hypothetical protein BDV12DRAFT_193252 [Aspergillus spectabilis]